MLAFDQQDSDSGGEEEGMFQTTPLHAPGLGYQHLAAEEGVEEQTRERTVSNTSQQIGRFEVSTYALYKG